MSEGISRPVHQLQVVAIDDNLYHLQAIERALSGSTGSYSFQVKTYQSFQEIEGARWVGNVDIYIVDLHLDKSDEPSGLSVIEEIRSSKDDATIVAHSSSRDPKTIIAALQAGASDFICKDSDSLDLPIRIIYAYEKGKQNQFPRVERTKGVDVIGGTFASLYRSVSRVAESAITSVHVFGESGTGKEVLADFFESTQPPGAPFVRVNCGAIAPTLVESELFGYVRGAFTGANQDRMGFFERANRGWIFLDEVASLPLIAQSALLRVIENQEVTRVGDHTPRKIKVRVLTATNESLDELVREGKFRNDLYQRLAEKVYSLPPLRERLDELPAFVEHFCRTMDGGPYECPESTQIILRSYDWNKGNVRELRNCLRAMTEHARDKVLSPLCIPEWLLKVNEGTDQAFSSEGGVVSDVVIDRRGGESFEDLTDRVMVALIDRLASSGVRYSLRSLASEIGLSKSTFSARIKRVIDKGLREQSYFDGILK